MERKKDIMKTHFRKIVVLFLLAPFSVLAQEFEVPDYKLKKAEDFEQYSEDVLKGITWIKETPINEQENKRKIVYGFLMEWMTGSPFVHIAVDQRIVTFMGGETPDLLMLFLAGWTEQELKSGKKDKFMGNLKGVEAVMDFYEKNKSVLPKDKNVEKYIKMRDKGTLEDFIKKNI